MVAVFLKILTSTHLEGLRTKLLLTTFYDNGTVSVSRHAAVMCPIVVLHGKLASKYARLQKYHVAFGSDIQVVQKYVFAFYH